VDFNEARDNGVAVAGVVSLEIKISGRKIPDFYSNLPANFFYLCQTVK